MAAPDESDVEWGIDRAPGVEGILESHWTQALTNHWRNFFVRFPTDGANCKNQFCSSDFQASLIRAIVG